MENKKASVEALKEFLTSYYGITYLAKAGAQDVVVRGVGWQHQSNAQACKVFHLRKLLEEELYPGD